MFKHIFFDNAHFYKVYVLYFFNMFPLSCVHLGF
jgi:hypothetical protein